MTQSIMNGMHSVVSCKLSTFAFWKEFWASSARIARTGMGGAAKEPRGSVDKATVNISVNTACKRKNDSKGKRRSNDDDDDGDTHPQPPSKRSKPTNAQHLACPFWKLDQQKHRDCFKHVLTRIRDVKLHLARKHTPFYCNRCWETFGDETDLDKHAAKPTACTPNSDPRPDWVTRAQTKQLSCRSDSKLSEQEQWFVMWDIIFPAVARPATAHVSTQLTEKLCQFREYSEARLPDLFAEEIVSDPTLSITTTWGEDPGVHLRRIIANVYPRIWDSYLSETSSNPSGPSSHGASQVLASSPSRTTVSDRTGVCAPKVDDGGTTESASIATKSMADSGVDRSTRITIGDFGFPVEPSVAGPDPSGQETIESGNWDIDFGLIDEDPLRQLFPPATNQWPLPTTDLLSGGPHQFDDSWFGSMEGPGTQE